MMNINLLSLIKDKQLLVVWSIVSSLIGLNWLAPVLNVLLRAIPELTNLVLARITATLLFVSIGLVASLIILHKKVKLKPDFSKYIHSPEEQCWLDPSDPNDRICPTCKLEDLLSPLSKSDSRWRCAKKEHGLFGKELPPASAFSEAMPTRKGFGLTHRNNNL